MRAAGVRMEHVPNQRVRHSVSPAWFVYPFQVRVGWEEYALRRVTSAAPNSSLQRAGPLEPLATAAWYVCLDMRTWPALEPLPRAWDREPAVALAARADPLGRQPAPLE